MTVVFWNAFWGKKNPSTINPLYASQFPYKHFQSEVSNPEVPPPHWAGEHPLNFYPRPIMNYWHSCSIRICIESQNKTIANRLICGFLNSEVSNLDRRQRQESPHWQMLMAEGLMWSQSQHLFSFPALIFLIKLLEHQFCLYQCFHSASAFSFKLYNSVTASII